MPPVFPLELLQAISDCQRGAGDDKLKIAARREHLKQLSTQLPQQYRSCDAVCFRNASLTKGDVWSLFAENHFDEKIQSWTLDLDYAKKHKGGVPPQGQGFQGVILKLRPEPEQVVINLDVLYQDDAFQRAMNAHRDKIAFYASGAGKYGGSQREVLLEVRSIAKPDIQALGGHSSTFEQLMLLAARRDLGREPTPSEVSAYAERFASERHRAGPGWVEGERLQSLLERMDGPTQHLRALKQAQAPASKDDCDGGRP